MDLNELREEFKTSSGFFFWENSELDKAINRGLKFLDEHCYSGKRDMRLYRTLVSGANRIVFPQKAQVVKSVWIMDLTERLELPKTDLNEIRGFDFTNGKPTAYLPISVEPASETINELTVPAMFADFVISGGSHRGLAFNKVADRDYYIEIFGRFFSIPLSDTFPTNWWAVNYPELVIMASLYTLDMRYRNSSGGMELKGPIVEALKEINNDEIEEELAGSSMAMEG